MSDLIEETTDDTTTGVGAVTVTIDDHKNKSYDPDEVTPDDNNNIVITLVSTGTKQWTYKPNPITINNGANFTHSVDATDTILTVNDNEEDEHTIPTHNYTCHVQNNAGESMDFDPIIKDRT